MERFKKISKITCSTALFLALQACAQTSANVFPQQQQPAPAAQAAPQAYTLSAQEKLTLRTAKQHFVQQEYDRAFESLLPLAIKGDPDAQYGIGYLFYYGKGVATDQDTGVKWIQKSAAQGFANAQKALQLLQIEPMQASAAQAMSVEVPVQVSLEQTPTAKPIPAQSSPAKLAQHQFKPQAVAPTTAPQHQSGSLRTYGPVQATDTLWSIAKANRPNHTVSVQQMMLAIIDANPQAFAGNNANAMKKGSVLAIPDLALVKQFTPQQAVAELIQQEKNWGK